jgi:hypothetical protein
MTPPRALSVASLLSVALLLAPDAGAQIRASERGSVSQMVDGTRIVVDYGRAQARGRDSLFGKVVTRDEIWTPGANQSTTFEVSRDVTVGGKPLPAGKYSMWMSSDPTKEWTLYFHKNAMLFHTQHPKPAEMALAVPVPHTTTGEHVEVLTFDFPVVTTTGTTLRLRWGTTTVPLEIGVTPSMPVVAMTAEQLAPFLGTYGVTFAGPNGKSPEMKVALVNAKGSLRGIMDTPGGGMEMQYIPTDTPNKFLPAFMKDGKITDVEVTTPVEFRIVDGHATGFTALFNGKPWMEGTRKP